ncbi:hypothetical protein E5288_WYG013535 [Bos mutus]|nr:hypothetical protein [Bos mutus]
MQVGWDDSREEDGSGVQSISPDEASASGSSVLSSVTSAPKAMLDSSLEKQPKSASFPYRCLYFLNMMAQRLLLRRFLTSIISGKPSQSRWAPVASRALQTPQYSPGYLTVTPSQARSIYTTRVCSTTFNIQDGPDFQDRVVNSETPVVVDFHAQWCGPCKILGPRLEKVVAKQHGKVVMAKVDIDDHTDLALEYEVSAVPTVLAMKNGDVVDKFVGIKDEDQLEAFLKKLIG